MLVLTLKRWFLFCVVVCVLFWAAVFILVRAAIAGDETVEWDAPGRHTDGTPVLTNELWYIVEHRTGTNGWAEVAFTQETTCTFTNLPAGYHLYRARAGYTNGMWSAWSNIATGKVYGIPNAIWIRVRDGGVRLNVESR